MSGRLISSICIVFVFLCGYLPVQAQEEKPSVIIMPFNTNAAGKYAYLSESLRNMLSSRIAAKGDIQIRDYPLSQKELKKIKSLKNHEGANSILAHLHVDYIAVGAMYSVSDTLNLQVTFYPIAGNGKPVNFSMVAKNENDVFPSLDLLVDEIDSRIVQHRKNQDIEKKTSVNETGKERQPGVGKGIVGFQTEHPEKKYKKGVYATGNIVGESDGILVSANGVRKSSQISMEMVNMAVGDLDGDGIKEIVLVGSGEFRIFHFQNGRFLQIASGEIPKRLRVHAVNLADLDHDGKDEIYISATNGESISSLIAKWDGKNRLQILHQSIPWYIRPLMIPGKGVVLAGQGGGPGENNLVYPGIYNLKIKKGSTRITTGAMLSVPKEVNLFNFVFADLNGDGQVETVAIDRQEKLLVYDQGKTLLWVSTDKFGSSTNYLGPSWTTDIASQDRIYVPTRLIALDINNDKKQEIIIARNKRTSYGILSDIINQSNFRMYSGSYVSCMEWGGSAMHELWHTNALAGMVADYSLQLGASVNGILRTVPPPSDHQETTGKRSAVLFVGQVPSETIYNLVLPKSSETNLFAYGLNLMQKKTGN